MSEACLYVFAIATGENPPMPAEGCEVVSAGNLHAVFRPATTGEFAQLTSEADGEVPAALAELLLHHDETVRCIFASHDVLPMRFGMGVPSREALATYLIERRPGLEQRLERVRGHAEWTVHWRYTEPPVPQPAGAGPGGGRGYLARRKQELLAAHDARAGFRAFAERVHQKLLAVASAALPSSGGDGRLELSCAYLVPRGQDSAFLSLVESCQAGAGHEGAEMRVTGPWPPYSFCAGDTSEL